MSATLLGLIGETERGKTARLSFGENDFGYNDSYNSILFKYYYKTLIEVENYLILD